MKCFSLAVVLVCLLMGGLIAKDEWNNSKFDGLWIGNDNHSTRACIISDGRDGRHFSYFGLYGTSKEINKGNYGIGTCSLAFSVHRNGDATMQVLDPKTGELMNINLVDLARSLKQKEEK